MHKSLANCFVKIDTVSYMETFCQ